MTSCCTGRSRPGAPRTNEPRHGAAAPEPVAMDADRQRRPAVGLSTTLRRVIGPEFMADPTVRVAVADLDGESVAHAAAVRSGPALGIYAVGTVERYRRRGYGRAVTWAVLAAGVAAWKCEL